MKFAKILPNIKSVAKIVWEKEQGKQKF